MSPLRITASLLFFLAAAGAGAFGLGACGSTSGNAVSPDAASDVAGNDDSPAPCPPERPSPTSPCTNGGQVGCFYPNAGGCGGATCTCRGSSSWTCFTGGGSCDAAPSDGFGDVDASDGGTGDGGTGDGGTGDGDLSDGETCPASLPPIGGSCSGGLSCSYCDGGALCDCNQGQWECGGALGCMETHD